MFGGFWTVSGHIRSSDNSAVRILPHRFQNAPSFLREGGHSVKITNFSTILLRYPEVDVEALVRAVDARLVGIDLHWMAHIQGSLLFCGG